MVGQLPSELFIRIGKEQDLNALVQVKAVNENQ